MHNIQHKIIKGNVTEVKKSILDGLPKILNDFFCPIKTCPLVSDVVPFGPQTKTVNHFQTIQSSASNIKSPFGCEYASSTNAEQTENSEVVQWKNPWRELKSTDAGSALILIYRALNSLKKTSIWIDSANL